MLYSLFKERAGTSCLPPYSPLVSKGSKYTCACAEDVLERAHAWLGVGEDWCPRPPPPACWVLRPVCVGGGDEVGVGVALFTRVDVTFHAPRPGPKPHQNLHVFVYCFDPPVLSPPPPRPPQLPSPSQRPYIRKMMHSALNL